MMRHELEKLSELTTKKDKTPADVAQLKELALSRREEILTKPDSARRKIYLKNINKILRTPEKSFNPKEFELPPDRGDW